MASIILKGSELWGAEAAQARNLGFNLRLKMHGNAAFAQLVPITRRAKRACRAHRAEAIEANQVIPPAAPREYATLQLEATRDAIHSALAMARAAC